MLCLKNTGIFDNFSRPLRYEEKKALAVCALEGRRSRCVVSRHYSPNASNVTCIDNHILNCILVLCEYIFIFPGLRLTFDLPLE